MATPVKFAVAAIPATFGVPDIDSNDGPSPCCEHCILPPPNKRILTQLLARMPRIIAVLLPFLWRKRVGVEPTGDRKTCRPPVLKTGTITGPHALPEEPSRLFRLRDDSQVRL